MRLHGRAGTLRELRALVREGRSGALLGPPGSGRSALLDALAADLTAAGGTAHLVMGRDGSAGVPLAPFAPLLADAGVTLEEPLAVYTALPQHLSASGATVLVDDVAALDRASSVLVAQLNRAGLPLVVTGTEEADLPEPVREGLAARRWTRIDLAPLAPDDVLAQAADLLGDDLDAPGAARVLACSGGLPALVAEVVEAGRDGMRRSEQGLSLGPALLTTSSRRRLAGELASLAPEVRHVAELVAVADLVPAAAFSPATTEAALDAGIVRLDGRLLVPATPLVRAAVLDALGRSGARGRREEVVSLLGDDPDWSGLTVLLRARNGHPIPVGAAQDAARRALAAFRPGEAREILAACTPPAGDARAAAWHDALEGSALSCEGDLVPASTLLDRAERGCPDPDLQLAVGQELGLLHAVRRDDAATAVARVAALADRLAPAARAPLDADLVKWHLMAGLPAPDVPGAATQAAAAERVSLALITAMVRSLDGPLREAEVAVEDGLRWLAEAEGAAPHARDLLHLSRYLALAFGGRLVEAEELATAERDRAARAVAPALGMWEYATAELALQAGRLGVADALAGRSVRHLAWRDFTGLRTCAVALCAAVAARTGRLAAATRTLESLSPEQRADVKVDLHLARVEAEQQLHLRRPAQAADALATAGRRAVAEQHRFLGVMAIDEAFLLDPRPELVEELAAHRDESPVIAALADRATALLAGDPVALEDHADRLGELALHGRAAQARACAVHLHERRGSPEAARRVRNRALASAAAQEATPWPATSASEALTPRELEIAVLAARRVRSREIAERLGLSVRTVDNHLSRIFRKLGVSRRDGLADALGLEEPQRA